MIARVDKLMAKERQVYERKGGRLQKQRRTMMGATTAPGSTMEEMPEDASKKDNAGKTDRLSGEEPVDKAKEQASQDNLPQN